MELRHLRYFLAVVEHGSVSRAADQVLVAQPALSRQIRRLESELGFPLFDRGTGRLLLTPAGRSFLPIARDLLARASAAREAATALATGQVSQLTVAAPVTTIADVVAPFVADTSADDPMITVQEVLPAEAYAALHSGADLAVSSAPVPRHLATLPVARLPVLAYVPPRHPWGDRATVGLAELVTQPLLLLTAEHGTRRLLDHAVLRAGVRYHVALETAGPQIAQALAAAGHGVAVVSDDPRYGLHALGIDGGDGPLRIALHAAWDPSHYAAPVITELSRRLRGFCVARYGASAAP